MKCLEYALRTFEAKNLLFKDNGSDAEKVIIRLVLKAYMGDYYKEIELSNNNNDTLCVHVVV